MVGDYTTINQSYFGYDRQVIIIRTKQGFFVTMQVVGSNTGRRMMMKIKQQQDNSLNLVNATITDE